MLVQKKSYQFTGRKYEYGSHSGITLIVDVIIHHAIVWSGYLAAKVRLCIHTIRVKYTSSVSRNLLEASPVGYKNVIITKTVISSVRWQRWLDQVETIPFMWHPQQELGSWRVILIVRRSGDALTSEKARAYISTTRRANSVGSTTICFGLVSVLTNTIK